jgi:hypothetical protein
MKRVKGLIINCLGGLVFAAACVATGAALAQATIADCEKIQAADAYNQCLAKFGPPAKVGNLEPERPGDIKANSADAAASGGRPKRSFVRVGSRGHRWRRGTRFVQHTRGGGGHGRKRMVIVVGK